MELELSDIRVSLKKDAGKSSQQRDTLLASSSYQLKAIPTRGSSGTRKTDTGILDKIYHLERSMEKFKGVFIRRESSLMELVTNATEANLIAQKANEGLIGQKASEGRPESRGSQPEDGGTDTKPILYSRIKELQRLNNELLGELRAANTKLLSVKFDKDKGESELVESKTWTQPGIQRRGYSQSRETDVEAEKRQLNAKLIILNKELEKSNQMHEGKIIEIKTDYRKKLDVYLMKLANASNCVNKFLVAMQKLQMGVVNRDEHNMDKLRNEFEMQKTQLVNLAKDIKIFDDSSKRETVKRVNLSAKEAKEGVKRGRLTLDDTKKLEEEMLNLKKEHEKTIIEKAQLESLVETLKRNTRQRPQSSQRPQEPQTSQYKNSEVTLKKHIAELEGIIKERDNELYKVRKSSGAVFKLHFTPLIGRIEKKLLTKLSELDYRATVQIESLERLQNLAMRLLKEGFKLQQEDLDLKEEYETRAKRLTELEKRMGSLNTMKEEYKNIEAENKELKKKISEMQSVIEESNKKVTSVNTARDILAKKNKAKIDELTAKLSNANNEVQELKERMSESNSVKEHCTILLNSLKRSLGQMTEENKNAMQTKVNELVKRIKRLSDSILLARTIIKEQSKARHIPDKKKILNNAITRINKIIQGNNAVIENTIQRQNKKIISCNEGLKELLQSLQASKVEKENLLEDLLNEKNKVGSLNIALTDLEFDAKESIANVCERALLKAREISKHSLEKLKNQGKDLNSLRNLINRLNICYNEQRSELEMLRTQNEQLLSQVRNKEKVLKELSDSIANTKEQLVEREAEMNNLKSRLNNADREIDHLRSENKGRIESSLIDKEMIQEFTTKSRQLETKNEEEISELTSKLAEKEKENEELKETLQSKDELIEELKKIMKNATDLSKQLEESMETIAQLNTDKDHLIKYITAKEHALKESEEQLERLTSDNMKANQEIEELKQEVKSLKGALAEDKQHYENSATKEREELMRAKSDIEEKDIMISDLKTQYDTDIIELNNELLNKEDIIKKLTEEHNNLLLESENTIKEQEATINKLDEDIALINEKVKEKEKENKSLKAHYENEINGLTNALSESNNDLQERDQLIEELQKDNERLVQEKNKQIENFEARQKSMIDEFSTKLQTEESSLKEKDITIEYIKAEYEKIINSLNNNIQVNENELKERENEIIQLRDDLEELKAQSEQQVNELSKKLSSTEEALQENINIVSSLEEDKEQLLKELAEAENKLKASNTIIEKMKMEHENDLKEQIKKTEDELTQQLSTKNETELKEEQEKWEDRLKEKDRNIEILTNEYNIKVQSLENLAKEKDQAIENIQCANDDIVKKFNKDVAVLKQKIKENEEVIENLKKQNDEQVNEYSKKLVAAESNSQESSKAINEILESYKKKVEELNNSLLMQENTIHDKDEIIEDLKELNAQEMRKMEEKLLKIHNEFKVVQSNDEEKNKVLSDLRTQYESRINELNKELKEKQVLLEDEKMLSESKIKQLNDELEKLSKDIGEKNELIETNKTTYESEIADLNKKLEDIQKSAEEVRTTYDEKINELNDEVSTLKDQLRDKDETLELLKTTKDNEVREGTSKLMELQSNIEKRDMEIGNLNTEYNKKIEQLNEILEDTKNNLQRKEKEVLAKSEEVEQRDERIKEMAKLIEGSKTESGKELNELYTKLTEKEDSNKKQQKEIEELKSQLNQLQDTLLEHQEEIKTRDTIMKDLKVSYEEQFNNLKKEFEDKEIDVREHFSNAIKAKEDEIEKANSNVQSLEGLIEEQKKTIEKSEEDYKELQAQHKNEITAIEAELKESKDTLEELRANNEIEKDELSQRTNQLETTCTQLEEDNKKLKEDQMKDKATIDSLKSKLKDNKVDVMDMQEIFDTKFTQLKSAVISSVNELEEQINKAKDKLLRNCVRLKESKEGLKKQLEDSEEKCKGLDTLAIELSTKVNKEQHVASSLNENLNICRQKQRESILSIKEQFNTMLLNTTSKIMRAVDKNGEDIKELENILSKVKNEQAQRYNDTLDQLNEVIEENISLARKNDELITQKDKLFKGILDSIKHEYNEDELILEKDDIIKDLNDGITGLDIKNNKQSLIEEKKEFAKDLALTVNEKAELINQKDNLIRKVIEDIYAQCESYQEKYKEVVAEFEQVKGGEDSLKTLIETTKLKYKSIIQEAINRANIINEDHNILILDAVEETKRRIDSLESVLEQLQQRYLDMKEVQDSMIIEHKNQIDNLAHEITDKEKQLQGLLEGAKELNQQLVILQEDNNELNAKSITQHKKLLKPLKAMRERIDEENVVIQMDVNEMLENLRQKMSSIENKIKILNDTQSSSKQSMIEVIKEKEDIINLLNRRIETLKQENEKTISKTETSQMEGLDVLIQELNDKFMKKEEEHSKTMEVLMDKMMAIKVENADLKSQIEDLQERNLTPGKGTPQKSITDALKKELNLQVNRLAEEQKKNKILIKEHKQIKELLSKLSNMIIIPKEAMNKLNSLEQRLKYITNTINGIQLPNHIKDTTKQVLKYQNAIKHIEYRLKYLLTAVNNSKETERILGKIQHLYKLLLENKKSKSNLSERIEKMKKHYDDLMAENSELRLKVRALEKASGNLLAQSETGSVHSNSSGPKAESLARTQQPTGAHLEEDKKAQILTHATSVVIKIAEMIPLG